MTTDRLGIGILGCGFIARAHLRGYMAFPTETKITALYNRSLTNAEAARDYIQSYARGQAGQLANRIPHPQSDNDISQLEQAREALLQLAAADITITDRWQDLAENDAVDAVSNTVPPYLHFASTRDMLDAGKHILLEKPFACSLAEADALIALAAVKQVNLSVVSQGRYADDQRRMRALVAHNKLGRVHLLKCDTHWYRNNSYYALHWRGHWANECGGALLNHGWHLLDQSLFIVGKRVRSVSAKMGAFMHTPLHDKARHGVPTEDTIVAVLEFEDGTLGEVTAGVTLHAQRAQIEVFGDKAAMQLIPFDVASQDTAYGAELRAWADTSVQPQPAEWTPPQAERDTIDGVRQYRDPTWTHTAQVHDFLDAIAAGRETFSSGQDARATQEVILAAYKSAITGEVATLPIAKDDPFYRGVDVALTG